ncbi:MAG: Hpt domain-containing protein [Bacteroidales bacterium]
MIADLNYLRTMSGGDDHFIREMIALFREQIDEYEAQMPELLKKGDYLRLSKMAHKAKSSVAVMGMKRESDMLKELEKLALEQKEVDRYAGMIQTFLDQSRAALRELEQPSPGTL